MKRLRNFQVKGAGSRLGHGLLLGPVVEMTSKNCGTSSERRKFWGSVTDRLCFLWRWTNDMGIGDAQGSLRGSLWTGVET